MKTILLVLATMASMFLNTAQAYEEPKFEVVGRFEGFELRAYAPYTVAEVTTEGSLEDARSAAFRILFRYITGSNQPKQKVEMTTPVVTAPAVKGESIQMTVPVISAPNQQGKDSAGQSFVSQFVLPARFSAETAPTPSDARVKVKQIGPELVAVRTYSGSINEANFADHLETLKSLLKSSDYVISGPHRAAVYNGPLTPWFMRRNEVMIPVVKK